MGETPAELGDQEPLRVLIVEDAMPVASLMDAALRDEGMHTEIALTGSEAVAAKVRFQPHVVLLDLGLPDMDGYELIGHFAQEGDCGIIVVTALDAERERVAGLEVGADDYMTKPVPLKELAARIRAVHRRLIRPPIADPTGEARVTLDYAHRQLLGPGRISTALTEAEFSALAAMLEASGASVSRDELGRIALRRSLTADDRSVDQLVLKIRRKLALHGIPHRNILSSRGVGYVIADFSRFVLLRAEPQASSDGP